MQVHAIAGLPRSGSTLQCNIFNQNKDVHATSTSCLPNFVRSMIANTQAVEFKNLLNIDSKKAQKRILDSARGFTDKWCGAEGKPVVIDKSRGWTGLNVAFRDLYPKGKIIICIRDLRDVFASIVRHDQANGLIGGTTPLVNKYQECFTVNDKHQGMIGAPLMAIHNLLNTNPTNVIFIQYESFVANPKDTLVELYKEMGLKPFEHQFDDVKNTSYDCDGFYLNKFPHTGSGIVKPGESKFSEWITKDIAEDIIAKYPLFNEMFGYK